MAIRNRNGKLEWRFQIDGHTYSEITELVDTARNRTKALLLEAEARQKVMDGRGDELRIRIEPFTSAADAFAKWCEGEYKEHPNSWKRLRTSMTSAKMMFGKRPISSVTGGDIEDYKSLRRTVHGVKEVTLRHDLHAISLLFQYGMKHNWCKANPVSGVEIPSDSESNRMRILTPAEEKKYLGALEMMRTDRVKTKRRRDIQACDDLLDICLLMLNQGCRPEELRELEQADVDLTVGKFRIVRGKSRAAKRVLLMTAASRDIFTKRMATPNKWVFPSSRKAAEHIGPAQRLHESALEKANLAAAFVPYDLRHTFATRAVERGMDLPRLAAVLGHANLRSVMKYVHLQQAHIDEAMRQFDAGATSEKIYKVRPEIVQ